jgi:hypothetical protein
MRSLALPLVEAAHGRVAKFEADSLYVIFEKPAHALTLIVEVDGATAILNADTRTCEADQAICSH